MTRDAAERIRANGGRLYLWSRPVGRFGLSDRLGFRPAPDVEFECHFDAKTGVELCVPPDFPFSEVIVRARGWPFAGVRVYVDGRRWGWRGEPVLGT